MKGLFKIRCLSNYLVMKISPWIRILSVITVGFGTLMILHFVFPIWACPFLDFIQKFGVLFGATFGILGAYSTARLLAREEQINYRQKVAQGMSHNFYNAFNKIIESNKTLAKSLGYEEGSAKSIILKKGTLNAGNGIDKHYQDLICGTFLIFDNTDFVFLWKEDAKYFDGEVYEKISTAFSMMEYMNTKHEAVVKSAMAEGYYSYDGMIQIRKLCITSLFEAAEILRDTFAPDAMHPSDKLMLVIDAIKTEKTVS